MNGISNILKLFVVICMTFWNAEAILKNEEDPRNVDRQVTFGTALDTKEYEKVAHSNAVGIYRSEGREPYHHITERIQIIDFLARNLIEQLSLTLVDPSDLVKVDFKNSHLSKIVMLCERDGKFFLAQKLRKKCGKLFTKYLDNILDPRGNEKSVANAIKDGEIIKALMGDDKLDDAVRGFLRAIVCNTAVVYSLPCWKSGKATSRPQTYILAKDRNQVKLRSEIK